MNPNPYNRRLYTLDEVIAMLAPITGPETADRAVHEHVARTVDQVASDDEIAADELDVIARHTEHDPAIAGDPEREPDAAQIVLPDWMRARVELDAGEHPSAAARLAALRAELTAEAPAATTVDRDRPNDDGWSR